LPCFPGNRFEALGGGRNGLVDLSLGGEGAMAVTAIHPGEHLAEELKEVGMSAAELARRLDVPTNRITGILNGQRAITGDAALRLAHFFGTSAEFWLNLQTPYELRTARKEVGKSLNALPRLRRAERIPA
jgi:addiction module HigA family antidote